MACHFNVCRLAQPEGILESLQNTLSSLDSQSVAAEQPAPPGIAPASSASSVDTDSHVDQADLLGLHDAEQSSAPQRVPAQVCISFLVTWSRHTRHCLCDCPATTGLVELATHCRCRLTVGLLVQHSCQMEVSSCCTHVS